MVNRLSWLFAILGPVLITLGGVVANVTAGASFQGECGSPRFCASGLLIFLFGSYEGWMICGGLILSAISALSIFDDKDKIDALQADLQYREQSEADLLSTHEMLSDKLSKLRIDTFQLISILLGDIYKSLGLGINERISVYKVDADRFSMIGRHSDHVTFASPRRKLYHKGQGIVHKAWEIEWSEAVIHSDPIGNLDGYCEELSRKHGMSTAVSRRMRMKSRAYKALALTGSRSGRIAVVVVESIDRRALDHVQREDLENWVRPLIVMIEALENHFSRLDDAIAEGL